MFQAKIYWSNLKSFYNDRKVLLIPPLLIDDKFVTDILTKINFFNKFFSDQFQPLNNASDLPKNQIFFTQSRLGPLEFNEGEILQIIRALNINKVYGHDDISIRMIKICERSLLKPLIVLSRKSIKSFCYRNNWRKSNIIPFQKNKTKKT